jgi:hypothetical protein
MISKPDDLPSDLVSALAALQAEREARLQAEAVAASARAELSANEALVPLEKTPRQPVPGRQVPFPPHLRLFVLVIGLPSANCLQRRVAQS